MAHLALVESCHVGAEGAWQPVFFPHVVLHKLCWRSRDRSAAAGLDRLNHASYLAESIIVQTVVNAIFSAGEELDFEVRGL